MYEEMNQLEFKYHLLSQLSNYKELRKLLTNGDTEKAIEKLDDFISIITESLSKN